GSPPPGARAAGASGLLRTDEEGADEVVPRAFRADLDDVADHLARPLRELGQLVGSADAPARRRQAAAERERHVDDVGLLADRAPDGILGRDDISVRYIDQPIDRRVRARARHPGPAQGAGAPRLRAEEAADRGAGAVLQRVVRLALPGAGPPRGGPGGEGGG